MIEIVNGQMQLSIRMILKSKNLRKTLVAKIGSVKKKFGLKTIDIEILLYLFWKKDADVSAGEISKELILNKGQVSTSLDDMLNKEYVIIKLSEKDKRVRYYNLTKKGMKLVENINVKTNEFCQELLSDISEDEIRVFHEVIEKIEKKFDYLIKQ